MSSWLTCKGGYFIDIKEALRKRKEHETKIIAKALEDDEFRKELLKNPKAVLEKEGGRPLPEGLSIRVVEEEPNSVTIVLPQVPESVDVQGELSDEALEQMAGGVGVTSLFISFI